MDKKLFYCWTVIRYNFKLNITFYNISNNTNGKILLQIYINQILEPTIKLYLFRKVGFCLKKR